MTKLEALAKDCIENHTHRLVDRPTEQDIYLREESIFIQGYRQSEKRITELEVKIKHLTKHLEPQTMSALFEQVEEEFKQEQRIKELEAQIEKMKSQYDYAFNQLCKLRIIKYDCHEGTQLRGVME